MGLQAARLLHMSGTDFYYGPQGELAKKLAEIAPGSGAKRVFFTNSGAESVEAAFKLLYLALQNVSKKWQSVQGWREALRQFTIRWPDRMQQGLSG